MIKAAFSKPLFFCFSLWVYALLAPGIAWGVEGYPGAAWGNATHDSSGPYGTGSMGWLRQGIDWIILPGTIKLNTFVSYNYRLRTKIRNYFNSDGPSAGIELKKSPLALGADYYEEHFRELGRVSYNKEVYLTWYFRSQFGWRFPFSSWGKLIQDTSGVTGSSALGWIKQGVLLKRLPGEIDFNAFAEYNYRGRTKEKTYYDARGPSIGIEFEKAFLTLAVSRSWETLPRLNEKLNKTEIYLGWYYTWDLDRLR